MLDLNNMIIFARVVDAGSISGAAREMGLPKSTISRKLKLLEESLSVRLLQRTTRSLTLTELGAAFYERCKQVQAEAEEAERSVSLGQERPTGTLRVTAPVEMGLTRFGRIIAEYSGIYPDVRIELDLSNRFVDIVEEGYDLAIRAGRLPDSTLIARRLGNSRMLVCASPEYIESHSTPDTPDDLNRHTLLLYGNRLIKGNWTFSGPEGTINVQLQPRHCANSLTVLRDMVLSGHGIALLPASHVLPDVAVGRLVLLLEEWRLPEEGIYAVYPSPRHLSPKVKSFIDFLENRIEPTP
jgi:DNA-binding transcriptional LysR family regulator